MRITCVGGGPAGLYFAVVAKLRDPAREVVVVERNPPGTTYGWGVVYWDSLRHALHRVDATSAREITARSVTWTGQQLRMGERVVHLGGYGYSIERRQLLDVLQARARQLGVQMRFEETVDDAANVDADVVVAADGHMSALRSRRAEVFGTSIRTGGNAYIWLGTSKEFKDFTFGCERTDAGWLWYHGYQFARGASTVIVECADATRRGLGLDALDDSAGLEMLADVFRRAPRRRSLAQRQAGPAPGPVVALPDAHERTLVRRTVSSYSGTPPTPRTTRSVRAPAWRWRTPSRWATRSQHPASTWRAPCVAMPTNGGPRWRGGKRRRRRARRGSSRWTSTSRTGRWRSRTPCSAVGTRAPRRHSADIDRSAWYYRLLHATQNPALRQARWLVGAARRRRAAARLR